VYAYAKSVILGVGFRLEPEIHQRLGVRIFPRSFFFCFLGVYGSGVMVCFIFLCGGVGEAVKRGVLLGPDCLVPESNAWQLASVRIRLAEAEKSESCCVKL
jgi:hypothetical protein